MSVLAIYYDFRDIFTTTADHLLYAIIALVVCSSAWLHDGHIIGGGDQPDGSNSWAYWWTGYSLEHFQNPFDGHFNYFPVGQQPVAQYNLLDAFLAYPFLVFGMYTDTISLLHSSFTPLPGNAYLGQNSRCIYITLLLESLMKPPAPAARIATWTPEPSASFFWLVGLSGILKISRGEGNWKWSIGTGLCVAATSLTYWYWGLFLVFASIPIWFAEFWFGIANAGKVGVALITTLVICVSVLALMRDYETLPGVIKNWNHGWILGPFLEETLGGDGH